MSIQPRTGLRLVVRLKPVRKAIVPRQAESWRNGVEEAARGAEEAPHKKQSRCSVTAPLPRLREGYTKTESLGQSGRGAKEHVLRWHQPCQIRR